MYAYGFNAHWLDNSSRVAPFGNPRINGYLLLPAAYRSLSRPSSAPDAKAFSLRPFQLDLVLISLNYAGFQSLEIVVYPSPFDEFSTFDYPCLEVITMLS